MEEETKTYERHEGTVIGEEEVANLNKILEEYMQGKKSIDDKATENYEWWKQRHWNYANTANKDEHRASAWLFNSIINKHADIMDSFPKPNILPREQDDEEDAKTLSKIFPTILEQSKYKKVYSNTANDLLITGGEIVGTFWDNELRDGMGDISIKQIDIHNLFWEPGISDIQDSAYVFNVAMVDDETLKEMYPDVDLVTGKTLHTAEYVHDDTINTDNKSAVVDCYYKVKSAVPVMEDLKTGEVLTKNKVILHMCKFCNGKVLFSSEDEPGYEKGFYEHGEYPFVVTPLFPVKDTPWGFGWVDVMKDPQLYIDNIDHCIGKVAMMAANPRFWVRKGCGINKEQFADWSEPFVEFEGNSVEDIIQQIEIKSVPGFVVNQKNSKIDELKETSGNRDFSQGGTTGGITAASAIASLQEAGAKLPRDINRIKYASCEDVCYQVLGLIRQFYTEDRTFRIDGEGGEYEFVTYNSANINGARRPIFDIKISAEKQSPFSRAAQNETAKEMYQMGWFNPENATASLVAIDMMEFEGKETIKQQIQHNDMFMKQFQTMMQVIAQADAMMPELQLAARAGLAAPQPQAPDQGKPMEGTAEERAAQIDKTEIAQARKARTKAANQSVPG